MTYFESISPNITAVNKTVLGVVWDTDTDEFAFRFGELLQRCAAKKWTKRNLLSVSVSVFDPLGIISPITARIKTIFQLLCKDKCSWDEEIPDEIGLVWKKFLDELADLKKIRVGRFVGMEIPEHGRRVELHGFCDSSGDVYCAVNYLRLFADDDVEVSFLASKTMAKT